MSLRKQSPPTIVPLWDEGAPGFESRKDEPELAKDYWVKNIHNPSLTVFLPPKDKATGAAVIIAPGGGHKELVFNAEGKEAAEYLASIGVVAFALKYRLAREEGSPYKLDVHPQQDAYRAMRLVRSRAKEWGIDPKRVGMLGFSAGGEVVSIVAYGKGDGDPNAPDPIDRENGKPSFQMLVYPGGFGIPETILPDAPPAFFLVANDDGATRSIMNLANKYRQAKASMEVHIFAQGQHAFNMGNRSKLTSIKTWPQRMADWLSDNGWLKKA
ncbi:alpha/beta hydrolase [Armatimonas sp.]|uniref:alpha/beta hydrolase n=1 Tax=Armatimonas sp. TaxID=1872638 RepID=UPI00375331E4